jgi:hypothetical protein
VITQVRPIRLASLSRFYSQSKEKSILSSFDRRLGPETRLGEFSEPINHNQKEKYAITLSQELGPWVALVKIFPAALLLHKKKLLTLVLFTNPMQLARKVSEGSRWEEL